MKLKNLFGDDWYNLLEKFIKGKGWKEIEEFLKSKLKDKKNIYPRPEIMFNAFSECPLKDLKIVILNNAPFEHETANDGLAFSVSDPNVMYKPPADARAFMEGLESDVYGGLNFDRSTDLRPLARQGVLLLNTSLTISKTEDGWEHHYPIWSPFIKDLLTNLSQNYQNIVYIFVGVNDFETLSDIIVPTKNYILTINHPSEANHFAQTYNTANTFKLANALLKTNKIKEIKW